MSKGGNKNQEASSAKQAASKRVNSQVEKFIQNASDLLEAFPSALVSIAPTQDSKGIKFTVSHTGQSKVLTLECENAKDISRVLAFIGPGGVTANNLSSDKSMNNNSGNSAGTEESKEPERITGLASIMSNHNFHGENKA